MKRITFLLALILWLGHAIAQPPPPPPPPGEFEEGKPGNEKIEAMKVAFITKMLKLTPEEAQKFWPVFDQYEQEKRELRKSTLGSIKELKDDGDFTAAEAETAISQYVLFKTKELDLLKKYITLFRNILPAQKVAKLISAEDRFKKMLAKQAQQGGPGGMPPKGKKPPK